MKIKNCIWVAISMAALFVACERPGVNKIDEPDAGPAKSVVIKIDNVVPMPAEATRGIQDAFTEAGVPVAATTQLSVYFADVSGKIVDVRTLTSGKDAEMPEMPELTENEYMFHTVPATAVQLAVTNLNGSVGGTLATLKDSEDAELLSAHQTLAGVPVWGLSNTFTPRTDDTHGHGVDAIYVVYDAGNVTVMPSLARLEIGNIQCVDLNGGTQVGGFYPRFGSLELARIGIHDTPLTTFGSAIGNYPLTAAGETAWKADAAAGVWNIDEISGVTLDNRPDTDIPLTVWDGEVYAYNVKAGPTPNIILDIKNGNQNTNIEGAVNVDFAFPYYVKTSGLQANGENITSLAAGTIYRVNLSFHCGNVKPWTQESEFICVDVTVTIPNWVVYQDTLTPTYN